MMALPTQKNSGNQTPAKNPRDTVIFLKRRYFPGNPKNPETTRC
jgi:hypothetical protein